MILFAASIGLSYSQSVPQGINYQAVARDNDGEIIAEKEVELKVRLLTVKNEEDIFYEELHTVKTNKLGLFTVIIGKGQPISGEFKKTPWKEEEIWVNVDIKYEGQAAFTPITNSKLYTVPYAFVAGEVMDPSDNDTRYQITNCPCQVGLVKLDVYYLGADNVTIKVYADANLNKLVNTFSNVMSGHTLQFDATLNPPNGTFTDVTYVEIIGSQNSVTPMNTKCTDYDQDLNNPVAGETFGNFSVLTHTDKNNSMCSACDMKPDWKLGGNALFDDCNIIGTLTPADFVFNTDNTERMRIYKDGDVNITNTLDVGIDLNVGNNADIGNDLTVRKNVNLNTLGGSTNNYGPFTVSQVSPSHLTGTLTVEEATDLKKTLNVDGITDLNSTLRVNNQSASELSGSLTVDGVSLLNNTLNVKGTTTLEHTLEVLRQAELRDSLIVDSIAILKGGVIIGGKATFESQVTISVTDDEVSTFDTQDSTADNGMNYNAYGLQVEGINQGIAVKVRGDRGNKNNFVSFWDNSTTAGATTPSGATVTSPTPTMWGRIEGEREFPISEYSNNADYLFDQRSLSYDVLDADLDLAWTSIDLLMALNTLGGAIGGASACVGLGACAVLPAPSEIAAAVANLVLVAVQEGFAIYANVRAHDNRDIYNTNKTTFRGVTYASGAGDYAEYLLRRDVAEKMTFGDIVGVSGAMVSKNTENADKMMVVSYKPIVLGNMPQPNMEDNYEKVAFMGQVPVKVYGVVNIGDYIIPMGLNNGIGKAVSPSEIEIADLNKIVGIAWESSNIAHKITLINTAVGIDNSNTVTAVQKLEKKLNDQNSQIEELKNQILEINNILAGNDAGHIVSSPQNHQDPSSVVSNKNAPKAQEIYYYEITDQDFENGLNLALKQLRDSDVDLENNEFYKRLKNESGYKKEIKDKLQTKLDNTVHFHKEINKKMMER